MMETFLDLCQEIECPIAMEKTEWATSIITFLGVLLNGKSKFLSLPQDKKRKAIHLIDWVCANKKITVKTVQKLTGTLNFLNKIIIPGRTFTRRMYDKLKICNKNGHPLRQYHHVMVDSNFRKDCQVWKTFLDHACTAHELLYRPFVDFDETQKMAKVLNFYSDASANCQTGGAGAVFGNKWIYGTWGQQFIQNQRPSIEFLELAALYLALTTWENEPELQNSTIIIYCDNTSVRDMCNSMVSHCPQCMKILRLMALDGIRFNRKVKVRYFKSKLNILADALSRLDFQRFWEHAPESMNSWPDRIPEKIWPITKIWYNQQL